MTSVFYAPEAIDDLEEIIDFLDRQDPKLVEKFEADYTVALQRVSDFPEAWPKVTGRVRVKIVSKRFRYGIFFEYVKGTVFIGAVVHLTRKASRWKGRFRPRKNGA
jgi:plasmid stabilization system protein ParE